MLVGRVEHGYIITRNNYRPTPLKDQKGVEKASKTLPRKAV
jgi:hypothetical protein